MVNDAQTKTRAKFVQTAVELGNMLVLNASDELFNHVDEGLPMWASEGDRAIAVQITFDTPFSAPPIVTMGLSGIDCAHDQNLRFWLRPENVSATGFTISFGTWGDTHIARASASWQAVGLMASKAKSPRRT